MAVRMWELFGSQTGGMKDGTRTYAISGTDVFDTAIATLIANAPASLGAMQIDEQSHTVEQVAPSLWTGQVKYREIPKRKAPQPSTPTFISFSTGGGTQKIFQSLQTMGRFKASGIDTAPDFKGAIGVTDDAVNGVDIVVRRFCFKLRKVFEKSDVSNTFIQRLHQKTATVNSSMFYGFPPESVLLLGADGDNQRGDGKFDITLSFESSPNVESLTIGDSIVITKKGHEYIWFRYKKTVDELANPKMPIMKADVAYVERVYEIADFSDLGFGTSL